MERGGGFPVPHLRWRRVVVLSELLMNFGASEAQAFTLSNPATDDKTTHQTSEKL